MCYLWPRRRPSTDKAPGKGHPGPPDPATPAALRPRRPQLGRRWLRRRPAGPHDTAAAPGRRLAAGRPQLGQPLPGGQVEPDSEPRALALPAAIDTDGVTPDTAIMRDLPTTAARAHDRSRLPGEQAHLARRQLAGPQRWPAQQITRHVDTLPARARRRSRPPAVAKQRPRKTGSASRCAKKRAHSCRPGPPLQTSGHDGRNPHTHVFSWQGPMPAGDNRRQPLALILEQKLVLSTALPAAACFQAKSAIALELKPSEPGGT